MSKKNKLLAVCFVLLLILVKTAVHRIGDYEMRLAMQSSDDGPMAYAYAYKFKEIFDKDIDQRIRYASQSASAQNWVPGVLFKYFDVEPYWITYASTVLQTVLLGLSVFLLIYSLFPESILIAFISALASASFPVFDWNMALYGQIMFMPYAAHLAVPFSIFSIAFLYRKEKKLAILFNLLCGLVHPSFGVYTLVFNSVQILLDKSQLSFKDTFKTNFEKNKSVLYEIAAYFGLSCIFIIVPIVMQRTAPQIAPEIQFGNWECNGHLFPLNGHYCKGLAELWMRSVPILVVFVFGFLAFAKKSSVENTKIFRFISSIVVGVLLLILVNVYATYGRNWNLGLLATFRSSQVLSIILLGLSFVASTMAVQKGNLLFFPFFALTIAYLARAPNMVYLPNYAVILTAAFGLIPLYFRNKIWDNKIVSTVIFVLIGAYVTRLIGVDFHRKYTEASWAIVALGTIFIWMPINYRSVLAKAVLFIGVVYFGVDNINIENRNAVSEYSQAIYEAQLWAKDNSDPADGFIIPGIPTWRNLSRRPVVAFGGGTPYGTPIFANEYGDKVRAVVKAVRDQVSEPEGPIELERLNNKGLKLFAKEMGAGYLVVQNSKDLGAQLKLEKVFSNSVFSIYSLK